MKLSVTYHIVLFAFAFNLCETFVRFTNIKCEEHDPSFAIFSKCSLNVIRRSTVALNIHVVLFQLPIGNVSYNLSLHKKLNGYHPFLYNHTIDFCKFRRNPKKHPFVYIFYQVMMDYSNMNHTCPYNHDIIVKDLLVDEEKMRLLPLPKGDYMFQLKVGAYNDWKATVKAYIEVDLSFVD